MPSSSSQRPRSTTAPSSWAAPRHLGGERRLALPGLTGDQEHLTALVPRHPLQRRLGVLRVHLTPDDSRRRHVLQPTRQRDPLGRGRHLSDGERLPPELERLHPADHALELELPEGTQDVGASAPRHRLDQARQEDLTGLGAGAQTGGLDHRIPEAVLPLPRDLTPLRPTRIASRSAPLRRPPARPAAAWPRRSPGRSRQPGRTP